MAGIAIILDLWRKNPSFYSSNTLHSSGFLSATAAAASAAAAAPFASRFLFCSPKLPVAYCDAGAVIAEDYIPNLEKVPGSIFLHDAIKYSTKEYNIELKPLFSAFELRALAMTSLRSFLMFYLPLLEPDMREEEDDNFLEDSQEQRRLDLVVPFKKSLKQIVRETTVVTTRRILERIAVHYVSQRMACKLLKDVPKSAARKAQRGMPTTVYFFSVTRTTFRGHFLGVAASWIVQIGIEIYRYFSRIMNSKEEENDRVDKVKEAKLLGKKVSSVTVRCGASLVFASIGAGIGASLVRPSYGQWIGCAVGDLAGPIIISFCLDKSLHLEL